MSRPTLRTVITDDSSPNLVRPIATVSPGALATGRGRNSPTPAHRYPRIGARQE
jgi:hypothetical protein